jgi:hypothetical protein
VSELMLVCGELLNGRIQAELTLVCGELLNQRI